MAKSPIPCPFGSITWLVFFLILTCCNSSSQDPSFQILDVSSSLKHTRDVFSPKSYHLNLANNPNLPHNPLTLTLHPRHSLPNFVESFNNYTALTLSRLARDQAHVHSRFPQCTPRARPTIRSRAHSTRSHRAHRTKHSRAHSKRSRHSRERSTGSHRHSTSTYRTQLCQEHWQAPLISGVRLGSGEYFARLGLGQPVKEFFFALDTGSDLTWLQCQPCLSCYRQFDPIFDPSTSSTYDSIPCNSPKCSAADMFVCGGGNCLYVVAYGDNSHTIGNVAKDRLSFGKSGFLPGFVFGCGHENEGLYSGSAGILGSGSGPFSLPSQLNATSFSYCLVSRDSSSYSTLEFNSAMPADSVVAPMPRNRNIDTYFYVALIGILVGGRPVPIPPSKFLVDRRGGGGVIVDSGTSVSRFRPEIYAVLRDTFRSMTRELPAAGGFSVFDTCYNLSSRRAVRIPTLAFEFENGARLTLRASNYLIPVDSGGRFCFGFAETAGATGIIGNVQQQGTRVTFDLVGKRIGFSQNKC